jgi:4-alpha-glucanotransferase
VAYTGTHDNNTLLGYVWEQGEEQRRRMLEYFGFYDVDWNRSYETILRSMFVSHAGLLILPVQDLLLYGEDTRINRPGNSQGNWSYRITRDQLWEIRRDTFRGWNRLYGRL